MDTTNAPRDIYPTGTVIADRYEITSFLAQGGMAQVYVATQRQINREVALKVLASMYTSNPNVVARFMREAQFVGRLTHPNTVRLYDMGETPDHRLFIAMEMLYGEELSERIKLGCLPPEEAIHIAKQVAGSLSEAHQMGIIHRDLKPDNIFLTTHHMVKVLDFGIAKLRDDTNDTANGHRLTKAGTAPGTPEYMSPEQAKGQNLDGRSDLYSLGIVLYEMLCGHPPFENKSYLATILMQVQDPPPPLPETVPEPLRSYILNRLLSKDPNGRPDNADVFIAEIDGILHQLTPPIASTSQNQVKDEALDKARAEIEALKQALAQTRQELSRSQEQLSSSHSQPKISRTPQPAHEMPQMAPRRQPAPVQPMSSDPNDDYSAPPPRRSRAQQPAPPQRQQNLNDYIQAPPASQESRAQYRANPVDDDTTPPAARHSRAHMAPVPGPIMSAPEARDYSADSGHKRITSYGGGHRSSDDSPAQRQVPKTMHSIAAEHVPVAMNNRGDYNRHISHVQAVDLENMASSRPIDTLTGRQSMRPLQGKSVSNPQTTFMMFAQPLCSKMGPNKVHEALHLAQGIWNAAVLGGQAIEEIYAGTADKPALAKLIDVMLARKNKYFFEEIWQVDSLVIDTDEQGRLSIAFECRLPGE